MNEMIVTDSPVLPVLDAAQQRTAQWLAASDLVPSSYKGKPENVVAAAIHGRALGLELMQAMQSIAVINGRPSLYGDAALALVLRHPDCEDVVEEMAEDKSWARCTVHRRGRKPVTRDFTVEDARQAQLWDKPGPWTNYPARMLQMRARSFALRDSFADALAGFELAEVVRDLSPEPREVSGEVVTQRGGDAASEASRSDAVADLLETQGDPMGSENVAPAASEGVSGDIDTDVDKDPEALEESPGTSLEDMPLDQAVDQVLKQIEAAESLDDLREMQSDAFTVKHRTTGALKASITRAYNEKSKTLASE